MANIPKVLLSQYKLEFETTDITKQELCEKYRISLGQLKGHLGWSKDSAEESFPPPIPEVIDDIREPAQEIVPHPQQSGGTKLSLEMRDNIAEFKELAMEHCLHFMKNDARFAEVKEFKDIVAIVDTLEKSEEKHSTGPNINILVQNITERFVDDC